MNQTYATPDSHMPLYVLANPESSMHRISMENPSLGTPVKTGTGFQQDLQDPRIMMTERYSTVAIDILHPHDSYAKLIESPQQFVVPKLLPRTS